MHLKVACSGLATLPTDFTLFCPFVAGLDDPPKRHGHVCHYISYWCFNIKDALGRSFDSR